MTDQMSFLSHAVSKGINYAYQLPTEEAACEQNVCSLNIREVIN